MDLVVANHHSRSKVDYLHALLNYTVQQTDPETPAQPSLFSVTETPLLPPIKADINRVEDGIVTMIMGGKLVVEPKSLNALVSQEVLAAKVQAK